MTGPTRPSTPVPAVVDPGCWSVYDAGTRTVMQPVDVPNYKWFCEREDCGWSGDGYSTLRSAIDGAKRHDDAAHSDPQPTPTEHVVDPDGDWHCVRCGKDAFGPPPTECHRVTRPEENIMESQTCTLTADCEFPPHDALAHPCGKPWPAPHDVPDLSGVIGQPRKILGEWRAVPESVLDNITEGEREAAEDDLTSISQTRPDPA